MKIKFDAVLKDLRGKPINDEDGKPVTLQVITENALLAVFRDEAESMKGADKKALFLLACKCKGTADLNVEDVAKIRERIGRACPTLLVGRAYELLDG